MQPTRQDAPTLQEGQGSDSGRSKPARIVYQSGEELIVSHHYRDEHGDWCVHIDAHEGSKDLTITDDAVKHVDHLDADELAKHRTGFVEINTSNVDDVPTIVSRWAAVRDVRSDDSERSLVSDGASGPESGDYTRVERPSGNPHILTAATTPPTFPDDSKSEGRTD